MRIQVWPLSSLRMMLWPTVPTTIVTFFIFFLRRLGETPLDEIGEQRGHLARLLVPFLPRAQVHVVVLGKEHVHFGVGEQSAEILAGLSPMGVVVTWND